MALKISQQTVRRAIANGEIPTIRFGRSFASGIPRSMRY